MSLLQTLLIGGAAGAVGALLTRRLEIACDDLRWALRRGQRQWGPETATADEEQLARLIGVTAPQDIAADASRYDRWRRDLILRAGQRLFEDLRLSRERLVEQPVLGWRQLTVGQRLMVLAGCVEHLLQPLLRKLGQEAPHETAQHQDFVAADGAFIDRFNHVPSSGLQPGCGPEAAAGATPPSPSKDGAL